MVSSPEGSVGPELLRSKKAEVGSGRRTAGSGLAGGGGRSSKRSGGSGVADRGAFESSATGRASRRETSAYLERRADILKAAGDVIYDKSYHSVTMEEIADRVGMLKPALYYYFRSKEDLLFELAAGEQAVAFVQQFVDLDTSLKDRDAATRLEAAIARWIEYAESGKPKALLAIEREYRHLSGERLETVVELNKRLPGLLESIVQDGVDEGTFDPDTNVAMAVQSISDMLRGLYVSYTPAGALTVRDLRTWYTSFVLRGLGAS
jgi:TetR/AcrR family transcriptional regulator, cholesterol catabolism regulator